MELDILAIGPHPDDIELTCAGTIAKAVKQGYSAGIIDLTEGELGTRGSRELRRKEAATAAKVLGCVRENLHIPDGNIELNKTNLHKVIQVIRKYKPKVLLIPHFRERHPDHVHAHHLCREARFYAGLSKIETNLNGKKQDPWRPHICFHYMQWQEFTPSFIVDISDTYDQRMKAIMAYGSQFHNPKSKEPKTVLSHESFLGYVEARAIEFGFKISVKYGEPFYSVEPLGIKNIFELQMFKG
jgi:bacillithiol biosynthesis deacetylase BshB1